MKIALCICGQPRFYKKGFDHIKKYIIDPNNITDIFCHFWFDEKDVGKIGYENTSSTLIKDGYNNDVVVENLPTDIKNLYLPKKIKFEKQYDCNEFIKRDYSFKSNLTNPFATFSQYLSNDKCISLLEDYENETDVKYDVIIKCRYDIILDNIINIKRFDIKNNIIFHNDVNNYEKFIVNDGFFFGDSNCMKLLKKCYLKFDEYWVNYKNIIWDNHDLLGKYLEINNIKCDKKNLGNIRWIRK